MIFRHTGSSALSSSAADLPLPGLQHHTAVPPSQRYSVTATSLPSSTSLLMNFFSVYNTLAVSPEGGSTGYVPQGEFALSSVSPRDGSARPSRPLYPRFGRTQWSLAQRGEGQVRALRVWERHLAASQAAVLTVSGGLNAAKRTRGGGFFYAEGPSTELPAKRSFEAAKHQSGYLRGKYSLFSMHLVPAGCRRELEGGVRSSSTQIRTHQDTAGKE